MLSICTGQRNIGRILIKNQLNVLVHQLLNFSCSSLQMDSKRYSLATQLLATCSRKIGSGMGKNHTSTIDLSITVSDELISEKTMYKHCHVNLNSILVTHQAGIGYISMKHFLLSLELILALVVSTSNVKKMELL